MIAGQAYLHTLTYLTSEFKFHRLYESIDKDIHFYIHACKHTYIHTYIHTFTFHFLMSASAGATQSKSNQQTKLNTGIKAPYALYNNSYTHTYT